MNKKLISRRAAELSLLCGLLCSVFLSAAHFDAACDDLRNNVLRLHIIANSDGAEDQAVKLKVRDAVLEQTSDIFNGKTKLTDAEAAAEENIEKLNETAVKVLRENGFNYGAVSEIGNSYFETREYKDFTLPAGNYRSLIIRLGSGKGKNWWCVVFPAVCVPAASGARLSDSTAAESADIAEHPNRYIMKFKAVEIYEDLRKILADRQAD